MPIYEYECKKCKYKFEQLRKITDKPLRTCPKCHTASLAKLVSNTSFQLKGTGWYVTDFKNKNIDKGDKNKVTKTAAAEAPIVETKKKENGTKEKTKKDEKNETKK